MTNIFLSPLAYITVQEYQNSTTCDLKNQAQDDIHVYVAKSDAIITDLIRPLENIPVEIKKACVLLTDALYVNRSILDGMEREITSETIRGNSVTYARKKNIYDSIHPLCTQEIYIYLKPYLKKDPFGESRFYPVS